MAAVIAEQREPCPDVGRDAPDEVRTPEKTTVEVIDFGTTKVARITLEPVWQWSECVQPVVGGESCQVRHVGVVAHGALQMKHDDGTRSEAQAGDVYVIEPGHDARVVGDETFVAYEFESNTASRYAKPD